MRRYNQFIAGSLLYFLASLAIANITEGGKGMLFGRDHAFNVTAAQGWVLDNESGRQQGLHMLFYPTGENFADSPVIVYGSSTPRGEEKRGVAELVQSIVNDFHANGSENQHAIKLEPVTLKNGMSVPLYHYQGDQWGNYEAAAYFVEENTINFLVYHARSEAVFKRYYDDFVAMIRSYHNAFKEIRPSSEEAFTQLRLLAKQDTASKAGQAYETAAIQSIGQAMADVAGGCAGFFAPDEEKNFQVIFRITPLGEVAEAYTYPANGMAICFTGMIGAKRYPPHQFEDFLLHIDMKFQ